MKQRAADVNPHVLGCGFIRKVRIPYGMRKLTYFCAVTTYLCVLQNRQLCCILFEFLGTKFLPRTTNVWGGGNHAVAS
jgi:hypothetical protein